jgi:hypothetical protein
MQREINEQLIIDWIAALRSGKYKKETGQLRKNEGYCCLGVLCDLQNKGEWVRQEPVVDITYWTYLLKDSETILSAGLADADHAELIRHNIDVVPLVKMNDDRDPFGARQRHTFNEIADKIEEMFGARGARKEENV